jgi:hypothetical protein
MNLRFFPISLSFFTELYLKKDLFKNISLVVFHSICRHRYRQLKPLRRLLEVYFQMDYWRSVPGLAKAFKGFGLYVAKSPLKKKKILHGLNEIFTGYRYLNR